ncbi:hypothetical protein IFM89_034102 [Coptis chinensis]|uniref:DUF4408 domain-containing protein n=1 Tax=Coptis chinensis TaxID=261450 RepID=A0A835I6I7_9MAGN|nr:hypothetical protein IFM89_034102 [Coptis chinensis]
MANLFSNNFIFLRKFALYSVFILSIAITLMLNLSVISNFLILQLPELWGSFRSWLTPPYLYVIINFIIITIAASSRFQRNKIEEQMVLDDELVKIQEVLASPVEYEEPVVLRSPVDIQHVTKNSMPEFEAFEATVPEIMLLEGKKEEENLVERVENELAIWGATEMPIRKESMEIIPAVVDDLFISKGKPPVSGRFGHRKIAKGSPEGGKSLRVTKPKRHQDTLENTWKMITEGRSIPLARHLKKSDTWEMHSSNHNAGPQAHMKKSGTFNNDGNMSSSLTRSSGLSKLKKEPSLSQDDLNRRVESFINKFNEEMRLQRLESLNSYKEMIKCRDR